MRHIRLHVYELPQDTFECIDECAGYFVTGVAVEQLGVRVCVDPIAELGRRARRCASCRICGGCGTPSSRRACSFRSAAVVEASRQFAVTV